MYGHEYIKKMNGKYPKKYTVIEKIKILAGCLDYFLEDFSDRYPVIYFLGMYFVGFAVIGLLYSSLKFFV